MAAANSLGGGVEWGAGAQEEDLHRRTDAWRFLRRQHHWGDDAPGLDPIHLGSCLLSSGVTVFRGPEAEGYPFLEAPFRVGLITCPSSRKHPYLNDRRRYAQARVRRDVATCAETILTAAVASGCTTVVLGAIGLSLIHI
eukprot:1468402-Alexandrium_andersonii.AAC.1